MTHIVNGRLGTASPSPMIITAGKAALMIIRRGMAEGRTNV